MIAIRLGPLDSLTTCIKVNQGPVRHGVIKAKEIFCNSWKGCNLVMQFQSERFATVRDGFPSPLLVEDLSDASEGA